MGAKIRKLDFNIPLHFLTNVLSFYGYNKEKTLGGPGIWLMGAPIELSIMVISGDHEAPKQLLAYSVTAQELPPLLGTNLP